MEFDFTTVGIVGIVALLVLLGLGLHIAIDFLAVGMVGVTLLLGIDACISLTGETMYYAIATPTFCVLPLFILMGAFASRGGFAETCLSQRPYHRGAAAGLSGHRHLVRQRRLRLDLRVVAGHRDHLRQDRLPRDAPLQLRPRPSPSAASLRQAPSPA